MSGELLSGAPELLKRFRRQRGGELEIYEKRGRSRLFQIDERGETSLQTHESGWAMRGGDRHGSFFLAGSGELPPDPRWPEPTPHPLTLPPALPATPFFLSPASGAPLATESEGFALLNGVARELARELPGARAARLRLEEGVSDAALVSTRGVTARVRQRATLLRVEVESGAVGLEAEFVARSPAELKPLALARRLVDRALALAAPARPREALPAARRLLLAPPLAARLLEALAPRFVGSAARERLAALLDGEGRLGSPQLSIVDDGAFSGAPLAAPCDGEGVPSRAVAIVERGKFAAPLLAWWESDEPDDPREASGCSLRASWRDVPRRGTTQIYIVPEDKVTVADLLSELRQGAYLLAPEGGVQVDADGDSFSVAVSGFVLEAGRAAGGLGACRLHGRFGDWLRGIRVVARDLAFVPGVGLFGSPTLLVEGLALTSLSPPALP